MQVPTKLKPGAAILWVDSTRATCSLRPPEVMGTNSEWGVRASDVECE